MKFPTGFGGECHTRLLGVNLSGEADGTAGQRDNWVSAGSEGQRQSAFVCRSGVCTACVGVTVCACVPEREEKRVQRGGYVCLSE